MSHLVQWICLALLLITPTLSFAQDPTWSTVDASGNATERHENGFVAYDGKLYLIGGRSNKPVQIFDPATNSWSEGAFTPFQMHHFQAVVFNDLIYVIGAYTGTCCDSENGISHVWTYNPQTNQWNQSHEIPQDRRRGSTGAVVHNNKIYIAGGLEGGHGSPATAYDWFDEYDPITGQWKVMPDAPRKRDHFHAVIYNNKLYLTGGRDTSDNSILNKTISEVDVFDFNTGSWSTLSANLPTPRGGTTSILYRGEILVIGGESGNQTLAYSATEALNPDAQSWNTLSNLNVGRHGTQATLLDDAVYIAAGAAQVGGAPELNSIERYQDGSQQTFSFTQVLKSNWNLLSLPLETTNDFYSTIYNTVDLDGIVPHTWNGFDYVPTNQLDTGSAFWLKLKGNPSSVVQTITGLPVDQVQYSLSQGWNLISGPSCNNVPIVNSSTFPAGAIAEGLTYFYEIGGYKPAFSFSFPRGLINQGRGYWVFATTSASLTLSCNGGKHPIADTNVSPLQDLTRSFGSISIRDGDAGSQRLYFGSILDKPEQFISYKLPPKGPAGEFDVRYTDDSRLTQNDEAVIRINDASYPLSVTFDQAPSEKAGVLYVDEVSQAGTILHTQTLMESESLQVHDASASYLRIRFQEESLDLPHQFTLHGNYPNPFNPTTRITFDLPAQGDVILRVTDMLGREVSNEVFPDMAPASNQSISYDASSLPAGMYLYSLTFETDSQAFIQTGRMVLLK